MGIEGLKMSLGKILTCSVLFISLAGCQTVKFGDMFGSSEKAAPAESNNTLQIGQPQQLLSKLSAQAQQAFTQRDEVLAQKALENNFTNQISKWMITDGELMITPLKTFEKDKGQFCREYQTRLETTTIELSAKSTACRQENGLWIRQE